MSQSVNARLDNSLKQDASPNSAPFDLSNMPTDVTLCTFLFDVSGSMSDKTGVINPSTNQPYSLSELLLLAQNSMVADIKSDRNADLLRSGAFVRQVVFSETYRQIHPLVPATEMLQLSAVDLKPNGRTSLYGALLDALGEIEYVAEEITNTGRYVNVLVIVFTDLAENSSSISADVVAQKIREAENTERTQVIYVSLNGDWSGMRDMLRTMGVSRVEVPDPLDPDLGRYLRRLLRKVTEILAGRQQVLTPIENQ
jgi:uncharacterized protein YegL